LRPYFQIAVTSKQIIKKGPGWSNSLHLIEFFPKVHQFSKILILTLNSDSESGMYELMWPLWPWSHFAGQSAAALQGSLKGKLKGKFPSLQVERQVCRAN
jgi:hypothetical protein